MKTESYLTPLDNVARIPTHEGFALQNFDYSTKVKIATEQAMSSKWHNWNRKIKQGPWELGFKHSYITLAGIQNPPYAFLRNGKFHEQDLVNVTWWETGEYKTSNGVSAILRAGDGAADWDSTMYNSILVKEMKAFVEEHLRNQPEEPFFTYLALGSVHKPHTPPLKYLDGTSIAGQHDTKHMDVLKEMDKVVGSVVDVLKKQNVLEDTIIVFASDNGGLNHSVKAGHNSSGPLRDFKGSVYEGGHTIPLIMRWDNGMLPKGEKRTHLMGLNDIFATLADMAKIPIPYGQASDSISYASYAKDANNRIGLRQYLGIWKFMKSSHTHSALRKGSMKLVFHSKTKVVELYDLSQDISEENNVANQYPGLVKEMKAYLHQIGPCYDNPRRFEVKFTWAKSKQYRTCTWFSRRKNMRCRYNQDAILNCGKTCAIHERFCEDKFVELA